MTSLPFSNLYSHPNIPLERHLVQTAAIALENLKISPLQKIANFHKSTLASVLLSSTLIHDLGKATSFFQEYLLAPQEGKEELKRHPETQHSLLSAVAGFYAAYHQLEGQVAEDEERAFLSFLTFMIVRRHHGNLGNVIDEARVSKKNEGLLLKQVQSINEDELIILAQHLKQAGLKWAVLKSTLADGVASINGDLRKVRKDLRRLGRSSSLQYYLLTNFLFSLLIDADKSEVVIGGNIPRSRVHLDSQLVNDYKTRQEFSKSKINVLRQRAYQEILDKDIDLRDRVFSINLPTGLGKTFASFAFAFELRKTIIGHRGSTPRIIYALPFLSVIEQNAEEIARILETNGIQTDTNLLLRHHHLSEVYYSEQENEFEGSQAKILIEGWNSEIIITTFVQLFHTLISNKNKGLRKFHRLSGSIIILDEVQSIPSKYWLLIKEVLALVAVEMDAYLVFVTATEPLIFGRGEVYGLVNRQHYFQQMERVIMEPRLEKNLTLDEFLDGLALQAGRSYLFVLNTISSAKSFYQMLQEKTGEDIAFLSTHVTPFERLTRIREMKKGAVRLAVSTQLVEAGVDIDFDVVYRDLAPLDSLNQAAGRCNRNWGTKGSIIVVALHDGRRLYASYIYDRVLLEITRQILRGRKEIPESEFLAIIDAYYQKVQKRKSTDQSRELLEAVFKMKYDSVDGTTCINDFRLIAEERPKLDIFVEINEEAAIVWRKYWQLREIGNVFERRAAFDSIKADFYKFTISVPVTIDSIPPEVAGFRYINRSSLSEYYDQVTGFDPKGAVSIW